MCVLGCCICVLFVVLFGHLGHRGALSVAGCGGVGVFARFGWFLCGSVVPLVWFCHFCVYESGCGGVDEFWVWCAVVFGFECGCCAVVIFGDEVGVWVSL